MSQKHTLCYNSNKYCMRKIALIIFVFIIDVLVVSGQNNFCRINFDLGNRSNSGIINSICQDYLGYIWIGQSNGLYRFDGYNYKKIPSISESKYGISDNDIRCIFEDSYSILWIATRGGGLNRYNRETDSFSYFTNSSTNSKSISFNDISCIYEDKFNDLWIGTDGGGLNRLNRNNLTFEKIIDPDNSVISKTEKVLSIFRDNRDELYIGTWGNGLKKINLKSGHWESLTPNLEQFSINSHRNVWIIKRYSRNKLLLGTFGEGAILYDCTNKKIKPLGKISGKKIYALKKHNPDKWFVASDVGLESFKNGKTKLIDKEAEIHELTFDRDSNLWVGQMNKLWVLKNNFSSHKNITQFSDFCPTMIFVHKGKELWAVNSEKLVRFGKNNHIEKQWSIPGNHEIMSFSWWSKNTIAIATTEDLLLFDIKKESFKKQDFYIQNPRSSTFFVGVSDDSTKWIGELGCLFIIKHNTLNVITESRLPEFSMSHYVSDALIDKDGSYWLGTYGGGLNHLDATLNEVKVFKQNFLKANEISNNFIEKLVFDKYNRLWIATIDGLNLLEDPVLGKFKTFTTSDGLPDNKINSIVEDEDGFLWLGTANGLCRVNVDKMEFRTFSTVDGLPSNIFSKQSVVLFKNKIVMATTRGMVCFNPRSLGGEIKAPEAIIQSFSLFNNEVHPLKKSVLPKNIMAVKKLKLSYDQNYIGFSFTAFPYFNTKKVTYLVKLEGYDNDWQRSKINLINYQNVPPGNYIFKVRSTIGNAISNITSINIVIIPPWYKSQLAYLAYALLIIISVIFCVFYIIYHEKKKGLTKLRKYKIRKNREINDLKISFFSQISNELKNSLTLLINPLGKIEKSENSSEIRGQVKLVMSGTSKIKQLFEQLEDFKKIGTGEQQANITEGNLSAHLSRICKEYYDNTKYSGILFRYKIKPDDLFASFDACILQKIVKNILDFFMSHSTKKSNIVLNATINFENNRTWLFMCVSDNNEEITEEDLPILLEPFSIKRTYMPYGFGMAVTKELVEIINGKIFFKIEENKLVANLKLPLILEKRIDIKKQIISPETKNQLNLLLVIKYSELKNYLYKNFTRDYSVIACSTGEEALTLFKKRTANFIVSDYNLSGIDGLQLFHQIIKRSKNGNLPFVLLNEENNPKLKIKALQSGIYGYIQKPFNIDELHAVIRNYFVNRDKLKSILTSDNQSIQIKDVKITNHQKELLDSLILFMEKNYQESSLSVDSLCAGVNMSRSQLYRKMQSLTSLSVQEFIKNFRLKKAAILLRSGEYRISDIAYRTGFSDPKNFSKNFKNQYGVTPSQYVDKNNA